jgi:hypothetical protein
MAKGGDFEWEVAKKLSLWLTDNKRDDLICRTDSSGGRATKRIKKEKETNKYLYGDLKYSDDLAKPLFDKWSIECKTGYASKSKLKNGTKKIVNWDVLDLLDSKQKTPPFLQMWVQCTIDSCLSKREPILIFRRDQKLICVAITIDYYLELCKYFNYPKISKVEVFIPNIMSPYDKITVVRIEDFLLWINAKSILDLEIK